MLALRDVARSGVPDATIGEVDFVNVARGVPTRAREVVRRERVVDGDAGVKSSLVDDVLCGFSVIQREGYGRCRNIAVVDEVRRDVSTERDTRAIEEGQAGRVCVAQAE